ncbi:hypothetical protein [Streptococcus loxodontisalivarius]|uniref:Serotype determinant, transmembrane protein n=1 Tax=Streptococcus loxodontisalivarius TaxID=1349415 RepID=A0ABS2PRU7_9STRE|nr:hypothetical protein [Streptococcus loxodontisalivarius]MBM7642430.1 hypothetical protein [Streptococcus loxodontisalivarius]
MSLKRIILNAYYLAASLIFLIEATTFIKRNGDQIWFAERAQHLNYNYLGFAIERYMTWSSRLLIESATMYFSVHTILFQVVLFIGSFVFLKLFKNYFFKGNLILELTLPILFLATFFPDTYTSAGLIATVTNYLFPTFTFMIAWYMTEKRGPKWFYASIPFWIFTCMQEQFAIITFILCLFLLGRELLMAKGKVKMLNVYRLSAFGFGILGILSALVSPGSDIRSKSEITSWYSQFSKLTVLDKIYQGFVETNRMVFLNLTFSVVFLLLAALVLLAFLKRDWISGLISLAVSALLILTKLEMIDWLKSIIKAITVKDIYKGLVYNLAKQDWLTPTLFFLVLILLLVIVIFRVFDKSHAYLAFSMVAAGYASRMLISFSPTIYVSEERTYTPLIFTLFFVLIMASLDIYNELRKPFLKSEEI